ncbi:hypothetical protein Daus18300_010732 [Diaporthe australafricana]|uniref:Protein kinase domain-containing protein n=1 Tax=Diaporthe australafricana TaxID=127596 RepID=A0ABR3W9A0_9PEZI
MRSVSSVAWSAFVAGRSRGPLPLQQNFDLELYKEQTDLQPPSDISGRLFATFSANNDAAVHLLTLVKQTSSKKNYLSSSLRASEHSIGYALTLGTPYGDVKWFRPGRWRIGAGAGADLPLELLLCSDSLPSSTVARNSIDILHAQLEFHPVSGAFMVRSMCDRPLLYLDGSGPGRNSAIRDDTCHVLFMEHNRLQLGSYDFALDFVLRKKDHVSFKRMRDIILWNTNRAQPSRHLDPVPSREHYLCGKVVIHRRVHVVGHRSLYSGVNIHSGDPVAIIMSKLQPKTSDDIRHEVATLRQCRKHEHVVGIMDCWCEHQEQWPCGRDDKSPPPPDEDTICYTTTLPEYTLASFSWHGISISERESYFHQTLVGLGVIHQSQLIHGSVSPSTLTISGHVRTGFKAAVSLFEYEARAPGTGIWVVPEILDGSWRSTKQADIWGLAISWINTIRPFKTNEVTKQLHRNIIRKLDEWDLRPGLRDLVKSMVAWDPEDRPTAEVALAHPAWDLLKDKTGKKHAREKSSSMKKHAGEKSSSMKKHVGEKLSSTKKHAGEKSSSVEAKRVRFSS